jgi:hypothetical protein
LDGSGKGGERAVSLLLNQQGFGLVVVKFESVVRHPLFDVRDAGLHGLDDGVCLVRFGRIVELSVISKRLMEDRMRLQKSRERLSV